MSLFSHSNVKLFTTGSQAVSSLRGDTLEYRPLNGWSPNLRLQILKVALPGPGPTLLGSSLSHTFTHGTFGRFCAIAMNGFEQLKIKMFHAA